MMRSSRRTPLRRTSKTSGIQSTRESSANFLGASSMMSPQDSPMAAIMNPNATKDHGFIVHHPLRDKGNLLPEVFSVLGGFRTLWGLRQNLVDDLLIVRQKTSFLHSRHHDQPTWMQ